MLVTAVEVTVKRKIPITDYGSIELGGSVWAQIGPEEDYEAAMATLSGALQERIRGDFEALPDPLKAYYREVVRKNAPTGKVTVKEVHQAAAERAEQMDAIKKGES